MLVISRKKGEALKIGEDVEITIVSLKDGSVKLSIDAPENITILRKELINEITNENIEATIFDVDILKKDKINLKK